MNWTKKIVAAFPVLALVVISIGLGTLVINASQAAKELSVHNLRVKFMHTLVAANPKLAPLAVDLYADGEFSQQDLITLEKANGN